MKTAYTSKENTPNYIDRKEPPYFFIGILLILFISFFLLNYKP